MPSTPGLSLDLRFEYIDQDQPRAGRHDVGVGEVPAHHDEVRTLNRNWVATLDYASRGNWGLALKVPFVKRDHSHIHHHHENGQPVTLFEEWHFDELGDVQVLGRYRFAGGDLGQGVIGGIKLPTGDTDVINAGGDPAERSLQPGTGTTDLILGYYANASVIIGHHTPARLFVQAQVQAPVNEYHGFRPGVHYSADLGVSYPLSAKVSGLLQLNTLIKGRNRGDPLVAEPEDSGGTFVSLTPGISYALTPSSQLYGFVQLPIYERVNGVQLTADYSAAVGISWRF